ncbi:MAG: hypothetical protein JNK19_04630 [Tabrizicola sp.]|nr:hypothetical protein [Tabrizicola sp.]
MTKAVLIWLGTPSLCGIVYVGANFIYRISDETTKQADLDYIAEHCVAVPDIDGKEIVKKMVIDSGFDGTVYIYDGDPVLDSVPAFEVAWRGRLSELLCVRGIGCLLSPQLSPKCTSGAE